MKLFNSVQIVKSGIRRAFNRTKVSDTAAQDIKLLSEICQESHMLVASNGKTYWYYFPDTDENIPVAQYLMERNGVIPTFRNTRYFAGWGNRRFAFRLSLSYLMRHPEIKDFVEEIEEKNFFAEPNDGVRQQIINIRNQIQK